MVKFWPSQVVPLGCDWDLWCQRRLAGGQRRSLLEGETQAWGERFGQHVFSFLCVACYSLYTCRFSGYLELKETIQRLFPLSETKTLLILCCQPFYTVCNTEKYLNSYRKCRVFSLWSCSPVLYASSAWGCAFPPLPRSQILSGQERRSGMPLWSVFGKFSHWLHFSSETLFPRWNTLCIWSSERINVSVSEQELFPMLGLGKYKHWLLCISNGTASLP